MTYVRTLAAVLLLSIPATGLAQGGAAASPIDGVWKVAEVLTTGANASTNSSPQPSLVIFTRGHYSYISLNGASPRPAVPPAKDPAKLTDAEKLARYEDWSPLTANAGTFEIKGTTLTRHLMVAKNSGLMRNPTPSVSEFKLEGNTLWLTSKSAAGQPASETRTKLVRVQ